MTVEICKRLKADNGMILTDGTVYLSSIIIPEERSEKEFDEITIEEYEEYLATLESELIV
jgi:hypothetical protein